MLTTRRPHFHRRPIEAIDRKTHPLGALGLERHGLFHDRARKGKRGGVVGEEFVHVFSFLRGRTIEIGSDDDANRARRCQAPSFFLFFSFSFRRRRKAAKNFLRCKQKKNFAARVALSLFVASLHSSFSCPSARFFVFVSSQRHDEKEKSREEKARSTKKEKKSISTRESFFPCPWRRRKKEKRKKNDRVGEFRIRPPALLDCSHRFSFFEARQPKKGRTLSPGLFEFEQLKGLERVQNKGNTVIVVFVDR